MALNRNSYNRSSLNIVSSSVAQSQQQQQQQYVQQQYYNNNAFYAVSPQPPPPVYQPPQPSWWNTGLAGIGGGRRNSYMTEEVEVETHPQQSIPSIQIEQPPNGYVNPSSGSSPTNQSHNRARNSSIAAAHNKLRIMAMLDDVRKKRELRDRRKSDIMAYLDDLMIPDDPALANAAAGALKLYRRRFKIYQFLNHPSTSTPWSITYHVMVFVIVFVCLILTICATIQQAPLQEKAIKSVYMLEKVVIVWFNIEFCLGIWSCACKKRYRGLMGKVRYLTIPSRLIDFVILSFTTIVLIVNPSKTGHEVFVISAFRGFHRFFQVAQVLTLNRPLKPWKVLASVIYDQREQLFIIYYTEFIVLCVLAYVAFLVERDINDNFNSIADAMWWAIVTLSTVGYGDRVPVTWIGKIISTLFTILGVAIFALPAGIIGTGLALKIEEVERNNIRNRKKVAAASLIQRAYRSWKAHRTYELVSKFFRERPMPIYKQHDYLSMAQKFIALLQFLVALNKFRELLRPVDWKTVMQSYSDGQTEVLLRTKLVQQSIEELSRRIEITENRVSNMSMKIETKQNIIEKNINNVKYSIDKCHRQLLANHLLIELLRTNNSRFYVNSTMTTGRKHTSSIALSRIGGIQQQQQQQIPTIFVGQNRTKIQKFIPKNTVPQILNDNNIINDQKQLSNLNNNSNNNKLLQPNTINNNNSNLTKSTPIRLNQLNLKKTKNLDTIASSGSNSSIDDFNTDDENDFFRISQSAATTLTASTTPSTSTTTTPNLLQTNGQMSTIINQQTQIRSTINNNTTPIPTSSSAGPIISTHSPSSLSSSLSSAFQQQQNQQQQQRRQNLQLSNQQTISTQQQQQQQQQQFHHQYRSRRMSL